MVKGGSRHTKKPEVDVGLLLKVLTEHSSLVQNLGAYEHIGRSQSCHPKGIVKVLPLAKGLIKLSETGEIHSSCLRSALMNLLMAQPNLNDSIYNGAVWCGSRVERIGVILFHMRRLKFASSEMKLATAHLTGADLQKVQEVLALMVQKSEIEDGPLPLVQREDSDGEPEPKRQLKKEISDVSLDSNGLPNCFNSPQDKGTGAAASSLSKGDAGAASSLSKGNAGVASSLAKGSAKEMDRPSFLRRRTGQHIVQETTQEENKNLQDALGFGGKKKADSKKKKKVEPKAKTLKKPAASLTKGGPKASLSKGTLKETLSKGSEERKPWKRLTWTQTKKAPWRAYISGSHKPNALAKDCRLIVECTLKRHMKYLDVLGKIYEKLETEHLTKEEALQLRTELEGSM